MPAAHHSITATTHTTASHATTAGTTGISDSSNDDRGDQCGCDYKKYSVHLLSSFFAL
jgi:hypothetical protein